MSRARPPATAGLGTRRRAPARHDSGDPAAVRARASAAVRRHAVRAAAAAPAAGDGDEVAGTRPYRPGRPTGAHRLAGIGAVVGRARHRRVRRPRVLSPTRRRVSTIVLRSTRGHGRSTLPRHRGSTSAARSETVGAADHGERSRRARRRRVCRRSTVASVVAPRSHGRLAAADAACGFVRRLGAFAPARRRVAAAGSRARFRPAASPSSSLTSSIGVPGVDLAAPAGARAGTSCPVVVQDPLWEQSFPDVGRGRPADRRSGDRTGRGSVDQRRERPAPGRKRTSAGSRRRCSASGGLGSIRCSSAPATSFEIARRFELWAERRRLLRAKRR